MAWWRTQDHATKAKGNSYFFETTTFPPMSPSVPIPLSFFVATWKLSISKFHYAWNEEFENPKDQFWIMRKHPKSFLPTSNLHACQ